MFEGERTTVLITFGTQSALLKISYRWWVPGSDPWVRTSGMGVIPAGGDWENAAINGSTSEVRMYSPSDGIVMTLSKFRRISVGSKGKGVFYPFYGYTIPGIQEINWEVIDVIT